MSKHQVLWVWPQQTKKTVDDELDDMFCAPCLTKMKQGACGKAMEAYLRCTYKVYKQNEDLQSCNEPFLAMVSCWRDNPKEYAKEVKSLAKREESLKSD